jgi:hypothetical protein
MRKYVGVRRGQQEPRTSEIFEGRIRWEWSYMIGFDRRPGCLSCVVANQSIQLEKGHKASGHIGQETIVKDGA